MRTRRPGLGRAPAARRLRAAPPRHVYLLGVALAAASCAASAQQALEPLVRDGQAQVLPGFEDPTQWIRHELWVETEVDSDGDGVRDRVHVAVTRPSQTETERVKVPVLYHSSPYFAGVGTVSSQYFWDVRQELGEEPPPREPMPPIPYRGARGQISGSLVGEWVPRGFAVVHSESPGTGLSQGCPTVGGPNESLAPKAVIDWLNGRARGYTEPVGGEPVDAFWSTGRVAMTGTSYDGTLALAAATTGVAGLEAIVPIAPNTSYYHYYRANGLVRSPGGFLGEDVDVLFDFIHSGDPARREHCIRAVREGELVAGQDRESGDYNEFWAGRDYLSQLDRVRAATLLVHGLSDWNVMPGHSVRVYEALRDRGVPAGLVLHQGGHGGAPPGELMNRWLTRWLFGVENGVEEDLPVWIVREGERTPTPYADFPNPAAEPVTLYPAPGGTARGGLALAPVSAGAVETLVDDVTHDGASLARAETSEHRLLYATLPLAAPLHLSGTPSVTVRLAADGPAANLSVWLVTLPWSDAGAAGSVVTRGWADPQNHGGPVGEPLEPGRFYDVTFELEPDDQVVPAGRRIALMIFSSDREFTLWPEPGTRLRVDLEGTRLTLPVVGGHAAWEGALP